MGGGEEEAEGDRLAGHCNVLYHTLSVLATKFTPQIFSRKAGKLHALTLTAGEGREESLPFVFYLLTLGGGSISKQMKSSCAPRTLFCLVPQSHPNNDLYFTAGDTKTF